MSITKSNNSSFCLEVAAQFFNVLNFLFSFFRNIKFNYCILDEGHVIKNGKTKLSKAIKQLAANFRVILSGTPIQVRCRLCCQIDLAVEMYFSPCIFTRQSMNIFLFCLFPEQCPRALVVVWLPHAGLSWNRTPVCCSLRETYPGQPWRQKFLTGTGGRYDGSSFQFSTDFYLFLNVTYFLRSGY